MFFKKTKAGYQLIANSLMWLCVPIVLTLKELIKGTELKAPFPKDDLLKMMEPTQLLIFFFAGFLYFSVLKFIGHKSESVSDQTNATFYADLGLDEIGSALYSFGSILILTLFVGSSFWYLGGGLLCYFAGYYLKPADVSAGISATNT